ncbi:unnamed protein product, partial [marine sediment metagenome]
NPYTGVAAIFSSRILNNHPPCIFEDGLQSRDFTHVSDIIRANLLAMENKKADYEVFNVGTGIMGEEQWKEYSGTVTVTSNGGTKTVSVSVTPTCVKVYPNPFNPWRSQLTFWGSGVPHAAIKVYTVSGELVKTLHEINGEDKIYWDGKNEEGKLVTRGIYLFVAINPEEKSVGRFVVMEP